MDKRRDGLSKDGTSPAGIAAVFSGNPTPKGRFKSLSHTKDLYSYSLAPLMFSRGHHGEPRLRFAM
jgi:hypothetical protein